MDAEKILDVRNLQVQFHSDDGIVRAVDDVSFHINTGETLAIVGESGSGKSVPSLAIMRLIASPPGKIAGGEIMFRGKSGQTQDLLKASNSQMRKLRGNDIAMIFQEPMTSLNPVYTVGDQIAEAIMLHQGKSRSQAMKLATDMLDLVEVPEPAKRIHYYPHQMSGGQRQRVMIAMALSCNPSLLIADEPTTALDVIIQAQILDLVRKLQHEIGASVLFITHDLGVVAEIADRVVVMQTGKIVETGNVKQIFADPQHDYTKRLLAAVPNIDMAKPAPAAKTKPSTLLSVRNLRKWFPVTGGVFQRTVGHIKAVNDMNLDLHRGEVLGLVGESGSGKTTAGRAILRLVEPTSGEVNFDGTDVTKLSPNQMRLFRRRMQIIFQDPYASLNPRMTIGNILAEPLVIHKLFNTRKERDRRVAELLDLVQLDPSFVNRYPHEFSGGQRQRVGIARALAVEPEFIVADECVSALDVSIQRDVLDLLKDLRTRLGLTMLFISHDLAVVEDISDRVAVMFKGDLVEVNDAYSIYRNPQDDYTKALLSAVPIPDPTRERKLIEWDPRAYTARREAAAAKSASAVAAD
jgi:ABC-type glutathione transport system ATPase component